VPDVRGASASSTGLSDEAGLRLAYASTSGVVVRNGTAYVAGTRTVGDAISDLLIPLHLVKYTARYKTTKAILKSKRVVKLVGHSLGGAVVADIVSKNKSLDGVTYGAPLAGFRKVPNLKTRRHDWDPVSLFDRSAKRFKTVGNPHSYTGFDDL
jgi:hypothetical protein